MDAGYQLFRQNVHELSAPLSKRLFEIAAHLPEKDHGYFEKELKDLARGLLWRNHRYSDNGDEDTRDRDFQIQMQTLWSIKDTILLIGFLKYLPKDEVQDILATIEELRQLYLPWTKKYGKYLREFDYAF